MSSIDHSERAHARLSASGSKRWLNCPRSVMLEDNLPDKKSTFADEGTAAHEVAEIRARARAFALGLISEPIDEVVTIGALMASDLGNYYSTEMENYVKVYVDYIFEKIAEDRESVVKFESKVDFSRFTSDADGEGFGTLDNQIITPRRLRIIDLKYGAGVKVFADDKSIVLHDRTLGNTQLMLYALGALEDPSLMTHHITEVVLTIVQPRLDHIDEHTVLVSDLFEWGTTECKAKAELALAGKGDFKTGEHCRFCKAKALCSQRSDEALEVAKYDFKDPSLLTVTDVSDILKMSDAVRSWLKDVDNWALEKAKEGVKFEGYKLVRANTQRKVGNVKGLEIELRLAGYKDELTHTPPSLKSLTDLKKVLKKEGFENLVEAYLIKPEGAATLAPDNDPRPEYSALSSAVQDFSIKN